MLCHGGCCRRSIGNQAEMMELEAAVIDGTRFLCYDDGATGSA